MVLLVAPEAPEQGFVIAISHEHAEANRFGVVMDKVVFEDQVEPEQSDQICCMGNWPQLGCSRGNTQGKHALHETLGVLHFFHGFASKPGGRFPIAPELHKGGLGHVLLNSRKLKAQGAAEVAQDARMDVVHADQLRRWAPE